MISNGIFSFDNKIATKNINPGIKVYNETLIEDENEEYRIWDPRRSKLSAGILNGLNLTELDNLTNENSNMGGHKQLKLLYLGASSGTTVSHLSDILINGLIYAIEFSPRMMRELVRLCENRPNIAPILSDASKPKKYLDIVEKVDIIYSDVAQPNQSEILMDNIDLFLKDNGLAIFMIKARSIDVSQRPKKIFKEEEKKLVSWGMNVLERVKLEPYEKDHLCLVLKKSF
ncbi:MAG: fibrillarin-like rRNA/tRNA 2'-O-methyltransferase [Methanobacteriaceae archaeon]